MKNLCFLSLFFAVISCSNDEIPLDTSSELATNSYSKFGDTLPQNSENPYDDAGRIQHEVLLSYYKGGSLASSLSGTIQIVDSIANQNSSYTSIKGSAIVVVPESRMLYLLSERDSTLARVLRNLPISLYAKQSLSGYVSSITTKVLNNDSYALIHDYSVDYEFDVVNDILLTTEEKELLLTTSSIARYSVFMKRKRPKKNTEPDWDWLTANLVGGAEGAVISSAEAISRAAVLGISDNK